MHITSLPSKYGIGVMGEETKRFIRRIKDMGFSYWQVLPLCPTDFYGSPYASPAAFALSPLLIDPDTLKNDGFVSEDDLARSVYYGSPYTADYEFAAKSRRELLKIAYQNKKNEVSAETEKFCEENPWCEEYALFCAAKEKFGGKPWYEWDEKFARVLFKFRVPPQSTLLYFNTFSAICKKDPADFTLQGHFSVMVYKSGLPKIKL